MPVAARVPRALLVGAVLCGAVLLHGCGTSVGGTAEESQGDPPATASTATGSTATSNGDGAPVSASAVLFAGACAGTLEVHDAGTVTSPAINEASGIAASRRNPDVWWTHNDSGDTARFFALSSSGKLLATEVVDGVKAVDWEDMTVGPPQTGSGGQTIYIADMGDNERKRSSIDVYRVPEPVVSTATTEVTSHLLMQGITLTYPDGAHDAEDLMVDPATGELLIVTKEVMGQSGIYWAPANLPASSETVLVRVGTLFLPPLSLVTSGDISPDGTLVAVRTYSQVLLYPRAEGLPVWAAFIQEPCTGPPPAERQGEAIAFTILGDAYATISEGLDPVLHLAHG